MNNYRLNICENESNYIFVDGALRSIIPMQLSYNPENGYELVYEANDGVKTIKSKSLPKIYANEDDYRNENHIHVIPVSSQDVSNLFTLNCCPGQELYYFGESGIETISLSKITFVADFKEKTCYVGNRNINYYDSKNYLDFCEDYRVIDKDGVERVNKSFKTKIALNDDQIKLWSKFVSLLKEMKESGMSIISDGDTGSIYAVGGYEYKFGYRTDISKMKYIDSRMFVSGVERCDASSLFSYGCICDCDTLPFYKTDNN